MKIEDLPNKGFVKIKDVMKFLDYKSKTSIYTLVKSKKLPLYRRYGSHLVWRIEDIKNDLIKLK